MESIIEIQNLKYEINNKKILDNISLKIKEGELVGLIGPNGAGKTTLLKCLNGIYKAEGTVNINGTAVSRMNSKKLAGKVALMHQNTQIGFPFPAREVVLMGRYPYLKRMQRESREDYKIARKNMEYTDTEMLEDYAINQMSGGERQRVLFAKTLTQETDIILLDEPTASLDITYQEQIFKYSRELSGQGKTVVAAIHDLKIAAKYCTRLVLMNDGRIVADGSPEEVLTSQNLSSVYGINALVYKNRITGLLDIYIHKLSEKNKSVKYHVIGGGGTAGSVIRQLYEQGYYISAGVFSQGDSDIASAEVFGIDYLIEKPFSNISDELFNENLAYIKNSNTTILCNMPFGQQNLRNLEAAAYAEKLVIIEDDLPEIRDFTGGKAIEIYNRLKRKAVAVINSSRLHEVL
ncbi:ABC transporter ATP-binding protein [Ruminiclostridium cellulolyticum]|uniref:ABC transporter related n=1 Tax=Ruminiclostridium cellulolyticum (strain ATCC 35319 / DSM 5812 / JCM 6584 / H10) TaxID=394503 RepID=B8I0G6_RUMCH|nr:ABC transporter ATP-binding protein [Ruminiclostridium cellulolyticum]ACL77492.1 ABC transporter related [Ruminiclostridium cellulolyticum H10]